MIDQKLAIAAILAVTLFLFVSGRWRYDVVALGALLAAVLVGAVPAAEAFSGLGDPAVITVALVLVLSGAIRQSGVLERALAYFGAVLDGPRTQVLAFTAVVTVLSAFMNNIGALAIVMPMALAAAQRASTPPSVLLMPLAFGSLLGGLVTLIGTPPNLLISGIRQQVTGAPFAMFDFAPVGGAVALAGVLYLAFAWRLLPADRRGEPSPEARFSVQDFVTDGRVIETSTYIGRSLAELEEVGEGEASVLALTTNGRLVHTPPREWTLAVGDIVVLEGDAAVLKRLIDTAGLELVGGKELGEEHKVSADMGTVEVVVGRSSKLIGQTSVSLRLRDMGVNVLAISRQGRRRTRRLSDERFKEGDVLALNGDRGHVAFLVRELGLLPLADRKIELGRRSNAWLPLAALMLAAAAASMEIVPIVVAFLTAVVALALLRVVRPGEMYEAVDPSLIVLMAALIPVTNAVQTSGGTEFVAGWLNEMLADVAPTVALGGVLVATMLVTPVLNNAATVLLMGPIAAAYASSAGLNIDAFLMAVAIGASCDFLTPFGHQSNTLVMGPGGYKFSDYTRLGLPLSALVILVAVPTITLAWPLRAHSG